MRNISSLALLVIMALARLGAAEETKYVLSISPQFGFLYGQALELVHPVPNDTKGKLLSELRWDIKPVFYLGARLDYGLRNPTRESGIFSCLSFNAGFPGKSGLMEDRDWTSVENDSLTIFSSHTNRTNHFFEANAVFGASIQIKKLFFIKPFLSGGWTRFSFTARDGSVRSAREKPPSGSGYYYPIEDNPYTDSFDGDVIYYRQNWFTLSPGISVGTEFLSGFYIDLSLKASFLTYCRAKDTHIERNMVFADYIYGNFFLEPAFNLAYCLKRVEFSLYLAYRRLGGGSGDSHQSVNGGDFFLTANKAGSGLSYLDTRFLVKILF